MTSVPDSTCPHPNPLPEGEGTARTVLPLPEGEETASQPGAASWLDAALAAALFCTFLLLYHANGEFLVGNDAVPNLYLPISVLSEGNLSFTPDEVPQMFAWTLSTDEGPCVVRFESWDQRAGDMLVRVRTASGPGLARLSEVDPTLGGGRTAGELRRAGRLQPLGPDYYLVPSIDPERRGYVGTFGPGAGLTAVPFFAAIWLVAGDLGHNKAALWYGGKLVASFCVSVSVVLVFLALRRLDRSPLAPRAEDPSRGARRLRFLPLRRPTLVGRWPALLIAAAYGAGTCVWAVSSQTLWQSGPNVMFLALAAYCLLRIREHSWWAAGCGLAAACAVLCRPTSAVVVMAIGVYLAVVASRRRLDADHPVSLRVAAKPLVLYVLAGLPLALWLGYEHWYYLGAPWTFPDTVASRQLALQKTGTPNVWSGSLLEGLSGLLWSPSRGMLVYSPVLGFAFWGLVRLWRRPDLDALRPLSIAVVLVLLLSAKWYDWPGGWSFGYRLMVDTMPLLAVCGAAVVDVVRQRRPLAVLFAVLLAWSVGVQVIGAYAYDVHGWNARSAYLVEWADQGRRVLVYDRAAAAAYAQEDKARVRAVSLDIDLKPNRRRLWRLADSQLVYYLTHFSESRQSKRRLVEDVLRTP